MTTQEWIAQARQHRDLLVDLVGTYHPAMYPAPKPEGARGRLVGQPPGNLPITAPNAEAACMMIREKIREETEESPIGALKDALDAGDVDKVNSLLSSAWFGVPESTSCWQIPGFKEAVDLMDDPPEPEDEPGIDDEPAF